MPGMKSGDPHPKDKLSNGEINIVIFYNNGEKGCYG
jgi:hypothetical protein